MDLLLLDNKNGMELKNYIMSDLMDFNNLLTGNTLNELRITLEDVNHFFWLKLIRILNSWSPTIL